MKTFLRYLIALALLFLAAAFVFRLLFPVPDVAGRDNSTAIPASLETRLGAAVLPLMQAHPGRSGVAALGDGNAAFAARLLLADAAQSSIDLRTYIWQRDVTGLMLLEAMRRAAERGVRVRLLLDDNGIAGLDPVLAELDTHPNIEIRLFNPFVFRGSRILSYALDFHRVNRRMHNKSMTIDGVVAIVGGRNIGDNYFSQSQSMNFFDLDVVTLGQAAQDVARDFDRYWASPSAIAADAILPAAPVGGTVLDAMVVVERATPGAEQYAAAVRASPLLEELSDNARGFDWVPTTLVSDDPAKGRGAASDEDLMAVQLLDLLRRPEREVALVSAYFIPGDTMTAALTDWAQSGLAVRVLTNAQEATDVLPVHSGYRIYRDRLVDAGVELHELKADQEPERLRSQFGIVGSRNSSLHAKSFVVDRNRVFIGSFNFDPRSARLNTEMGYLIESPELAARLAREFDGDMATRAYLVRRGPEGNLQWIETGPDGIVTVHDTEPGTSGFSRALVRLMGWLPVQWLL